MTPWSLVLVLVGGGVIAAFQVGKAAIAVPFLRHDLGISLASASWVIGAYGALGAVAGLPAGIAVAMIGPRRALLAGLCVIAAGTMLGALAQSALILIACRVLEGCGFLGVVIAVPTLLRGIVARPDQPLAFTFWSAFMPAGSTIMMALGPPLAGAFGWRMLWLVNGIAALSYAAVLWRLVPRDSVAGTPSLARPGLLIRAPASIALALAFGTYTFQYFAITGLLPTLLVDRMGLSVAAAGGITALTVAFNGLGNVAAGVLNRLGVPLWTIIAAAFAFLGLASFALFAPALPVATVALIACATLAVTGCIPASIYASAPQLVIGAELLALTMGLIVQASNLGQLLGPAALGAWVQRSGWGTAWFLFVIVAIIGIAWAAWLRSVLRARTTS